MNNAGTTSVRALDELTDEEWQEQWDLHVMAPMRLMRALAPAMAGAGGGRIVNVSSSSGKRPSLTNAAYSVTKAALLSLSRVFADEFAGDGVLVNSVAPGAGGDGAVDRGGRTRVPGGRRGPARRARRCSPRPTPSRRSAGWARRTRSPR